MNFLPSYTLVLSTQDIQKNVYSVGLNQTMEALIEQLTTAMINYDQQQTIMPIRSGFNYHHPPTGLAEWMPLYKHGEQVLFFSHTEKG
jgi:hypothetical protein